MNLAFRFVAPVICCAMIGACNYDHHQSSDELHNNDAVAGHAAVADDDIARDAGFAELPKGRAILSAVELGNPQALANYSRLRRSANVEWVEDLDYSVALALPRNPAAVLAMSDTPALLDRFCAPPFIEPEPGVEPAYLREAIKALRSMDAAGALGVRRAGCEARLQAFVKEDGAIHVRGTEKASAETFLRRLYAPYVAGDAGFDPTGKLAPTIFSPQLVRLIRLDAARANGEVGLLDSDPVCDCQDIAHFRVLSVQRLRSRVAEAVVRVRISNGGRTEALTYRLIKVRSGWRVGDIASRGSPSLVAFLETRHL